MQRLITAKITHTLKAAAFVVVIGLGAVLVARPFLDLSDSYDPLESDEPAYMDVEADSSLKQQLRLTSDSEIEDILSRPIEQVVRVKNGDTLSEVLVRAGVSGSDAPEVIEALKSVYNPRGLRANQRLTVSYDRVGDGLDKGKLQSISFSPDVMRIINVERTEKGFAGKQIEKEAHRQVAHYSGTIKSSLYVSAQNAGIPAPIIVNMIRELSYDVDFQRDIQSGHQFSVLFEGYYDNRGKLMRHGDILYASLTMDGQPIELYQFQPRSGNVGYFNHKGESIKKGLLKTPVDGARISSKFGLRRHPILGYNKLHKGIDFAVPTGTPVQAAGDGIVDFAGWNSGGYGNLVKLRHSSGYVTQYAHLSRIAKGLRNGQRVNQGEIIGYVGSTGRSTGPHLHYEVLRNNAHVNPLSVKMPTNVALTGRELEAFKARKAEIDRLRKQLPTSSRLAMVR